MAVLTQLSSPGLPRNAPNEVMVDFINRCFTGHLNATTTCSLNSASASTTVITDARIGLNSWIAFMPLTADATTTYLNTGSPMYVSTQTKGSATVNHLAMTQTDRNFRVAIITGL